MRESIDFEALESLRNYLAALRRSHVPTMNHYASASGEGFWHQPSKREKASLSSTATCVSSLVRAGLWNDTAHTWGSAAAVAARLLRKPWESAGLAENNPFGLSFIAEGVLDLQLAAPYDGAAADREVVFTEIVPLLLDEVESSTAPLAVPGSVAIRPYPPSAYLTQVAYRVLHRCHPKPDDRFQAVVKSVRFWARSEINRQVALISTRSRIADPLQLGYAIILASSASVDEQTSPEEKALIREALSLFFDCQQLDGLWPPSQPIFHYPDVGNAQCFDYELLTQLLHCEPLQPDLLEYLPKLQISAQQLEQSSFELGASSVGPARGWASGHHPQIAGPESWSTACVYDFVHAFDRLVAEAVRRTLFGELRAIYTPPQRTPEAGPEKVFAAGFLDARVKIGEEDRSLRETLLEYFVKPIERDKDRVANGGQLQPTTPMSAILFGPPGTSKTQLAKLISKYLGWPLLSVDPSYLVQDGLDRLYSQANRLFSMFSMAEQVVVLLDEFDEMGRDRSQNSDILSRFITTSMLPKLAAINEERKIVFLLATNYVSQFDAAFSRGGRFDMIIQIMPPTAEAKLAHPPWDAMTKAITALPEKKRNDAKAILDDLTFLETQQLVFSLERAGVDVMDEFHAAQKSSTLKRQNGTESWKKTCTDEQASIRLPAIRPIAGQ